ncbi:30S ribosomal protein S2 [Candidatus Gottesmanbacteria bacterium RBG_16_37_8]|uniref:Small ribosomal subunit protein uS2 n=1 Tax=Candidatus Gottesmanbacteria bacterium RBG_16_37_8 TaxID=1798371 RepID=A0A1F5YS38_9BACT|nr:MAG: 30S ribosomal protein S2 [Candidatus Gottesmanbacteria bacterium RBG_16_37_8]
MKEISLKDLLEAGCHFGHKVTRWHPKAASFIYQPREGVHIIDLVKTRDWLKKAAEFVYEMGKERKILLFIASKRQARGVVSEAAKKAALPYMTNRWIGGFMTNFEEVKKNIDKMNTWRKEKTDGTWEQQYPKHEVVKFNKHLRKIECVYDGVEKMTNLPDAVFIVDINKEMTALKEAGRKEIPVVAMVDTNANPNLVDYPIPANDDAVGSIAYIVNFIADAYIEGTKIGQKKEEPTAAPADAKDIAGKKEEKPVEKKKESPKKKEKVKKSK